MDSYSHRSHCIRLRGPRRQPASLETSSAQDLLRRRRRLGFGDAAWRRVCRGHLLGHSPFHDAPAATSDGIARGIGTIQETVMTEVPGACHSLRVRFAVAGQRPRNEPAQGNALGGRQKCPSPERAFPTLSPFQGWVFLWTKPRALPWAGLFAHLWCSGYSRVT